MDWLTKEVRAALEACPVEWTHDGSWPKNLQLSSCNAPTPSARRWTISESADATRLFWPKWIIPDDAALAIVEKHWREECERRGVGFASRDGLWTWDRPAIHGCEGNYDWMPLLACLANAILATQPKAVKA